MEDKRYKLIPSSYVLCGKEVEVLENTTTLYSDDFDKRVTLHTFSSGRPIVAVAHAGKHVKNELQGKESYMMTQMSGPAPLAQSFDTEDQAREWCEIHDLIIVPPGDKRIDKRYEL